MNPSSTPHPEIPNPNFTTPTTTTTTNPPPPDLSLTTTLSSLTHLLSLSHQTLSSLNSNFTLPNPQNDTHIPCPFNPHHLIPPHSLFSHSLHCPSPLNLPLDSLNYQNTLNPSTHSHFTQKLDNNPNIELCFSLDEYINFGSNFFYKDCPGVVNLFDLDSVKRTFTLPSVLSTECENFVGGVNEREIKGFDQMGFRVLVSDLWAIKREIELWSDYPNGYSFNVCCAVSGLNLVKVSDFKKWVIANSLRYGVVIDVYMRDHICVLFRLCLKAIVREAAAFGLVKGNLKSVNFRCPVLVQVLMWLASQLSVLFGEVNAKFFAINMLRYCVLEAARGLLLFPLEEEKVSGSLSLKEGAKSGEIKDVKMEEPNERSSECEIDRRVTAETVVSGVIFVSQVAAAVAALHERSLLEEKIKTLRFSQPLPRYQRMAEHAYVSKRADEERNKRSNYRPIIEHDGLPRQESSNQEMNKSKTREELLAEERDYKRRRMSYRGKKVKRTTLEVRRDIIEDFMEEIKQAGGIGCFVKGAKEGGILQSESPSAHAVATDFELRKSYSDSLEAVNTDHYRKQSRYDYNFRSTTLEDSSPKDYERLNQSLRGHHERLEDSRSIDRDKHGGEHYPGSLERHRRHGWSHEQSSHRRERGDAESTRTRQLEIKRQSSSISNHRDNILSYPVSNSSNNFSVRKDDQKLEVKDRRRRNTYENCNSEAVVQNTFEDRYDPSESHDMYEDDVYTGNKYVKPEEFHD